MNSELLKYAIRRVHKTQDQVATMLGISRQALANRFVGKTEFRVTEIRTLQKFLELTEQDVGDIFFK